jgi:predicted ATPase
MAVSSEMRKLQNKWRAGSAWPKRLEWIEIQGIRGWTGQKVEFQFPIVALVGENGSGKSTVLQAAASAYKASQKKEELYGSDFFPDTPFERIEAASIRFSFREGATSKERTVRKPTDRWRGNPERPERKVHNVDLRRIQPMGARVGYLKMLKAGVIEGEHSAFDVTKVSRFSEIMGKTYSNVGISTTSVHKARFVPVIQDNDSRYSGFHQGTGQITMAELMAVDFQQYSLVLIDEIETSLHPRAQRRLIRDLARIAREKEVQFILTTHSPYILEELPAEGRIYLMNEAGSRVVVTGVSPEFAMTKMDEEIHPECDIYVEDPRASALVSEMLIAFEKELLSRVKIVPYGSAQVGMALGLMASQNRFPRKSLVYLDADQAPSPGCVLLPGDDAPERVVFEGLAKENWPEISQRIGRGPSDTIDALNRAMSRDDHHDWVKEAANRLIVGSDTLWQAMCASWSTKCATPDDLKKVALPVQEILDS